jgi:hypothetical protein
MEDMIRALSASRPTPAIIEPDAEKIRKVA